MVLFNQQPSLVRRLCKVQNEREREIERHFSRATRLGNKTQPWADQKAGIISLLPNSCLRVCAKAAGWGIVRREPFEAKEAPNPLFPQPGYAKKSAYLGVRNKTVDNIGAAWACKVYSSIPMEKTTNKQTYIHPFHRSKKTASRMGAGGSRLEYGMGKGGEKTNKTPT